MCFCTKCADGDPLKCTEKDICGHWKDPKPRHSAGIDTPVDFPSTKTKQNEPYIREQLKNTRIMFGDIVSHTEEF